GNAGCWEQYASGRALVTEARQRAARSPTDARLLLELADGRAGAITGPMGTMGAIPDAPVALASFEAVGTWLGHGLADLAAVLDPRVFIIGGGVAEAGELLVGPAPASVEARLDR